MRMIVGTDTYTNICVRLIEFSQVPFIWWDQKEIVDRWLKNICTNKNYK